MITIDGYPIDAAVNETHSYEAEVTSYPVESGATITDNVKPKPVHLELDCVVSDSPLAAVLAARRAGSFADPAFQDPPSVEALDRLVTMMTDRSRGGVTIETGIKVYPNMILTLFTPTVDKSTGRALKFKCAFQQITIITNQRARIRVATQTGTAKKKISRPSVVIVNAPDADHRQVRTLSGHDAGWNDEHGRYEYVDEGGFNNGQPVPAKDLGDYKQYDGKETPLPPGGLPPDASELGPDGKPLNNTYFDFQEDNWKNTDGTPVTQQQLDAKRDPKFTNEGVTNTNTAAEEAREPWFQNRDWSPAPQQRDGAD